MDEVKSVDQLSEEQIKLMKQAVKVAHRRLGWAIVKFVAGLFVTNFVSLVLGAYIMGPDTDPGFIKGYSLFCCFLNAFFLGYYFQGQSQKISADLKQQINTIAKQH